LGKGPKYFFLKIKFTFLVSLSFQKLMLQKIGTDEKDRVSLNFLVGVNMYYSHIQSYQFMSKAGSIQFRGGGDKGE
jgi:hypothetical protein